MALSSGWRSKLRLLRSWRAAHFSLLMLTAPLLMSGSCSVRASLHMQPSCSYLG
ncbi:unnamed protein product [Musa textilis]